MAEQGTETLALRFNDDNTIRLDIKTMAKDHGVDEAQLHDAISSAFESLDRATLDKYMAVEDWYHQRASQKRIAQGADWPDGLDAQIKTMRDLDMFVTRDRDEFETKIEHGIRDHLQEANLLSDASANTRLSRTIASDIMLNVQNHHCVRYGSLDIEDAPYDKDITPHQTTMPQSIEAAAPAKVTKSDDGRLIVSFGDKFTLQLDTAEMAARFEDVSQEALDQSITQLFDDINGSPERLAKFLERRQQYYEHATQKRVELGGDWPETLAEQERLMSRELRKHQDGGQNYYHTISLNLRGKGLENSIANGTAATIEESFDSYLHEQCEALAEGEKTVLGAFGTWHSGAEQVETKSVNPTPPTNGAYDIEALKSRRSKTYEKAEAAYLEMRQAKTDKKTLYYDEALNKPFDKAAMELMKGIVPDEEFYQFSQALHAHFAAQHPEPAPVFAITKAGITFAVDTEALAHEYHAPQKEIEAIISETMERIDDQLITDEIEAAQKYTTLMAEAVKKYGPSWAKKADETDGMAMKFALREWGDPAFSLRHEIQKTIQEICEVSAEPGLATRERRLEGNYLLPFTSEVTGLLTRSVMNHYTETARGFEVAVDKAVGNDAVSTEPGHYDFAAIEALVPESFDQTFMAYKEMRAYKLGCIREHRLYPEEWHAKEAHYDSKVQRLAEAAGIHYTSEFGQALYNHFVERQPHVTDHFEGKHYFTVKPKGAPPLNIDTEYMKDKYRVSQEVVERHLATAVKKVPQKVVKLAEKTAQERAELRAEMIAKYGPGGENPDWRRTMRRDDDEALFLQRDKDQQHYGEAEFNHAMAAGNLQEHLFHELSDLPLSEAPNLEDPKKREAFNTDLSFQVTNALTRHYLETARGFKALSKDTTHKTAPSSKAKTDDETPQNRVVHPTLREGLKAEVEQPRDKRPDKRTREMYATEEHGQGRLL